MERKYIYCQNCGKKNDVGNEHCKKCGYRLSRISQPPQLVQTQLRTGGKSGRKTLFIVLGCAGGALLLAALVFALVKTDVLGRVFGRRAETTSSVSQTLPAETSSPDGQPTTAATTAPATTAPAAAVYNYIVNTQSSALNIRLGPATFYNDIGNIQKGTKLYIPFTLDGWGYVVYKGIDGFVSMQYLKRLGTPPHTTPGMPAITQFYQLKDTHTFDDGVSVGFDIKLPRIESAKPGAKQLNARLAQYKTSAEKDRALAGDIKQYDLLLYQRYGVTAFGNLIFILIYSNTGYAYSELSAGIDIFAYDFVKDKPFTDVEIAALYGKTEKEITVAVQKVFPADGTAEDTPKDITGFSKIDLFVTAESNLYAVCNYRPVVFTWFYLVDVP